MNIIVGLGNPGIVYQNTRHNVGFAMLRNLSQVFKAPKFALKKKMKSEVSKADDHVFVMPQSFMNGSGFSVKAVTDYYMDKKTADYSNLYVIHDDLDIPLGEYKIMFGTGPKVHNGLLSIYQHLKTKGFWHVRIGIDTREGDRRISSPVYVLQKFSPEEMEKLSQVKVRLVKELSAILNTK